MIFSSSTFRFSKILDHDTRQAKTATVNQCLTIRILGPQTRSRLSNPREHLLLRTQGKLELRLGGRGGVFLLRLLRNSFLERRLVRGRPAFPSGGRRGRWVNARRRVLFPAHGKIRKLAQRLRPRARFGTDGGLGREWRSVSRRIGGGSFGRRRCAFKGPPLRGRGGIGGGIVTTGSGFGDGGEGIGHRVQHLNGRSTGGCGRRGIGFFVKIGLAPFDEMLEARQ